MTLEEAVRSIVKANREAREAEDDRFARLETAIVTGSSDDFTRVVGELFDELDGDAEGPERTADAGG